jgi:hypothetical protein
MHGLHARRRAAAAAAPPRPRCRPPGRRLRGRGPQSKPRRTANPRSGNALRHATAEAASAAAATASGGGMPGGMASTPLWPRHPPRNGTHIVVNPSPGFFAPF